MQLNDKLYATYIYGMPLKNIIKIKKRCLTMSYTTYQSGPKKMVSISSPAQPL